MKQLNKLYNQKIKLPRVSGSQLLFKGFLCLLISMFGVIAHGAGINGDVAPRGNPDGILNWDDVTLVTEFADGTKIPTVQEKHIADVAPHTNPDKQITYSDALLIIRAITSSFNIDTLPPDPLPLLKTSVGYDNVQVTISVSANTIEPQASVTITNLNNTDTSNNSASTTVDVSGQFSLSLAANEGDEISIVLTDSNGNAGETTIVTALQNPAIKGSYPVAWVELDDPNGISGVTDPAGIIGPTHEVSAAWAKIMYPASAAPTVDNPTPAVSDTQINYPVVVFLHGNNLSCDDDGDGPGTTGVSAYTCPGDPDSGVTSEQQRIPVHEGFEYLMEVLASHGIMSVSISAQELSTGPRNSWAIPARGQLVLAYLDKIQQWSSDSSETDFNGLFTGKIDMSKIGLSGHSRGGYGVIAAQQMNKNRQNKHSIVAVNAIAPAPVDISEGPFIVTETPYFLLLGARDGDLGNNAFASYDDASMMFPKMAAHVYGANHNYFNEITTDFTGNVWAGASDDGQPYNSSDVMTAENQRQVAQTSIVAFFRWHLQGLSAYREVFTGRHRFPSFANDSVYWSFQDASRKIVDSFEEKNGAFYTTPIGGYLNHDGFSVFKQCSPLWLGIQGPLGSLPFLGLAECFENADPYQSSDWFNFPHIANRTGGLALVWDKAQTLIIQYPDVRAIDISAYNYLSFRAAKRATKIPGEATTPINVYVNIEDINGNTAVWDLRSDQYAVIPHPFKREGREICCLLLDTVRVGNRSQLTTVRIPLDHFTLYGSDINLQQISRIIIRTEGAAQMAIDDVEFVGNNSNG